MYQVTDPGFAPVERTVPASLKSREKGHYTILVRRIPWVKFRDLSQQMLRVQEKKKCVGRLLDEWGAESPVTAEQVKAWDEKGHTLVESMNEAARTEESIVREMVSWGIAGTKDLVDTNRCEHPFSFTKQEWLGKEWPLLSEQTLDLYHLLGILPALFSFVSDYQGNRLPETLDGFFPKVAEAPPVVVSLPPGKRAPHSNRLR